MTRNRFFLAVVVGLASLAPASEAADWPMWRHDPGRTATTDQVLSDELHLQWVRDLPPLDPAWLDVVNQDRMGFDDDYEPICVERTLLLASNRDNSLLAVDSRSGRVAWQFFADGPIRLAPAVADGRVFVASDDGMLYALDLKKGTLLWKVRGGPDGRRVTGNNRLISMWPVRGGPVVDDGVVYFAAGVWPFMGVFLHAVDARTGETVWRNETLGSNFIDHPHRGSTSFGGIGPQGSLALVGDKLLVPGGRSVPACVDAQTGSLDYYHLEGSTYHQLSGKADNKREGGFHVSGAGDFYLNHRGINTSLYDLATGEMYVMWEGTTFPVLDGSLCYRSGDTVLAQDLRQLEKVGEGKNRRWQSDPLWRFEVDATGALIKAGERLYAGGKGIVSAIRLTADGPRLGWQFRVRGEVRSLVAADDRLFVVTDSGKIYAFGAKEVDPPYHPVADRRAEIPKSAVRRAKALLEHATLDEGYCLVYGLTDGNLLRGLAAKSDLHVIGVDPDGEKIDRLRRELDGEGLYGAEVSLFVGDPASFAVPRYMGLVIASELPDAASRFAEKAVLQRMVAALRPYGGTIALSARTDDAGLPDEAATWFPENVRIRRSGDELTIVRAGALPGSAPWTHQNGDIANTTKSDDRRVKAPLGLLWFGATSHKDVLPRHAHGPPEQVIGGRLFIEGDNSLSARDVYTGKPLWTRRFDDLGTYGIYYDDTYVNNPLDTTYNQVHIAGANARGTNYVATEDRVYLVRGSDCLVLDARDGKTRKTFSLPDAPEGGETPDWTYIGVYEDLLIAGSDFVEFSDEYGFEEKGVWSEFDYAASKRLVVMDRESGKVRWSREATLSFRHNAIAVGGGKLFCIDSLPGPVLETMKRRGETPETPAVLTALDVRGGDPIWQTDESVFGTALAYSDERDLLVESGRNARDMIDGEVTDRMRVLRADDGDVVWDRRFQYGGPCMLHHDTIYLNAVSSEGNAVDLLTGELKTRVCSLTGVEEPWSYQRGYGCNSVVASEHLLTFRSGGAGYYDLNAECGTGNFGGFKSGCTSNLIAADGVLNAPDYTRTCTCPYPNQTSLALVHMPDVETWVTDAPVVDVVSGHRVRRVGINLGAPGDRRAGDGTLWLEHPRVGGPSPEVEVAVEGDVRYFRMHSSRIQDSEKPWVACCGLQGEATVRLKLAPGGETPSEDDNRYTVRLSFVEPNGEAKAGSRVFNVAVQGEEAWSEVDVAAQRGGSLRALVLEANDVVVDSELVVELSARKEGGAPVLCGVEAVLQER